MPIDFSAVQILIVLVIALLVFGPKRLPELGRQVGRGIRDLKAQVSSITDDVTGANEPAAERTKTTAAPSESATARVAVAGPDDAGDDLLDGVVVSGATGPTPPAPAES